MKRSSTSFTSHLSDLTTEKETESNSCSSDNSRFRRCKSYCEIRLDNKRHTRRKTSPTSYYDFSMSPELQRELNIGLDLVLLEQLKEEKKTTLPPSKFLPPPKSISLDATLDFLSLNISDSMDYEDVEVDTESSLSSVEYV